MRVFFAVAAMVLASVAAQAADTHEWNTILLEKVVDRTPDQTWAKIGGYCTIQIWLKLQSCVVTVGNQVGVGTNRRLNGKTDEMMIAVTPWSYTYAQLPTETQPASPIFYHGTLAVEPLDRGKKTKIVYTLFYDIGGLTAEQKLTDRANRSKRFGDAMDEMKKMAESP